MIINNSGHYSDKSMFNKRYVAILFLFCTIVFSGCSFLNNSKVEVLFIGNSYTIYNDMPLMFKMFCRKAGDNVYVDNCSVLGASLEYLSRTQMVEDMINSKNWDYIVLQSSPVNMSDSSMFSSEFLTLYRLKEIIISNNSNTKIIYPMLWSPEYGATINGELLREIYTYNEFQEMIYNGNLFITDSMDMLSAPIGWVWYYIVNNASDIELYDDDGYHPNTLGSYLCASVYYSLIFKKSSEGIDYYSNIAPAKAKLIQKASSDIVLNDYSTWTGVISIE